MNAVNNDVVTGAVAPVVEVAETAGVSDTTVPAAVVEQVAAEGSTSGNKAEPLHAIEKKSWAWYNNPAVFGGIRPRNVMPLARAFEVAQALGRPLNQEDFGFLIQKDGDRVVCSGCGKEFQPVRWAKVDKSLLAALKAGVQPGQLNGEVSWVGSRLLTVDLKGVPHIMAFCGAFFFFDPKRHDEVSGAEFFSVNRHSCLGMAYQHENNRDPKTGHARPLRTLASAEALVAQMAANHEARMKAARQEREQGQRAKAVGIGNAFSQWAQGSKTNGINGGPKGGGRRR